MKREGRYLFICSFLKSFFETFVLNTTLQTEISNFGRKMRTIWGDNFPLDYPFPKEYLFIFVSLRSQVNPST